MRRNLKRMMFVAILFISIGFAALTTTLLITGKVKIGVDESEFDIYFSEVLLDSVDISASSIASDGKSMSFVTNELKSVDQVSTVTYEVTNASKQFDAEVSVECSSGTDNDVILDNYLDIQYPDADSVIPARETGTGKIIIRLKKASIEEIDADIECKLVVNATERDSIAVGTGGSTGGVISAGDDETYGVSGYVIDNNNQTLPKANIVIYSDTPNFVTTDDEGYFEVDNLEMGSHEAYLLSGYTLEQIKAMDKNAHKSSASAVAYFTTSSRSITFDNGFQIVNELPDNREFTVYFNANGGSVSQSTKTVQNGDTYGSLPTPTLNGYIFSGWYTDLNYSSNITENSKVSLESDITLYAKWETKEYKVNFNTDGGNTIESITVKYNAYYGELPTPTKDGYTFLGWYLGDTEITQYSKFTSYTDVTLVAKWEVKVVKVTIEIDGVETEVEVGTNVSITDALTTPTKDGYDFTGWYLDEACTIPVTSDTTIPENGDITFYAKFESKTYVVSFDPNGGSLTLTSKDVTYNETYGDLPLPTKTGYNFVGWFTDKTSGTQITSSSTVSITDNIVLYARWSAKDDITYTVKHWQQNVDGGDTKNETNYSLVDTENLTGTTNTTVTPDTKSYDGFTSPSKQSITVKEDGSAEVNYYYTRNTYTLTVNKDAGVSSATANASYKYGASVSISYTIKDGYTFKSITGDKTTNTFTMPAKNTTVTINTTENTYTISYTLNGGTVSSSNPTSYTVTSNDITLNNPSKTGYTFTGWTGSNGTTAEKTVTIAKGSTGNKSYTANYNANTYTISFDSNGGNTVATVFTVTYNETYGQTFPTPTRDGYTFTGWYTASSGGSEVTSTTKVEILEDQTLYAHWTAKSYTVTLTANSGGTIGSSSVSVSYGGTKTFTVTPSSGYYLYSLTCTNGYTTNAKTGLTQTAAQTVTVSNNSKDSASTCTASFKDTSNAAAPVLSEKLIPITLANDGTVTKVSEDDQSWYNYNEKKWANAVILIDSPSKTYGVGDTILETDIESYFVWIPKYKYKLWNVNTMDSSDESPKHTIDIVFDTTNTTDVEGVSCATPMTTGNSGNCDNGEYMTHPAFISMNVNGLWVAKFETGYADASSKDAAQVNSSDSTKIIVKPNVYSWRSNTVSNMFIAAYNYERSLDSHMMKNTEWGAVAYLSHSKYGINQEININNNSSYKTGYSGLTTLDQSDYPGTYGDGDAYNQAYNTSTGYLASTTGNITGVYDMAGGAHEYMASYMDGQLGSSGFTADTLASYDSKYYDVYSSSSTITSYTYRILGDATGEMSPFTYYKDGDGNSRWHNSWYADNSTFVASSYPWFNRGGDCNVGVLAGQFYFTRYTGAVDSTLGSRLVLAIR